MPQSTEKRASKTAAVIHFLGSEKPEKEIIKLWGETIELQHVSCLGDIGAMAAYIHSFDGRVDAIALEGVATALQLGTEHVDHEEAEHLLAAATLTPVVDGLGVQAAVERWGVYLADEIEPGLWTRKQVLMVPGLNHSGLIEGLSQFSADMRFADPVVYFGLPGTLGIGSKESLGAVAQRTLSQLKRYPFNELYPQPDEASNGRGENLFKWADILAGDIGLIRANAPEKLTGKTVVTPWLSQADLDDLKKREASIVVTVLPNLSPDSHFFAHHSAAEIEAILVALLDEKVSGSRREQSYLQQLTELEWQPAIRYLNPEEARLNRFAYVHQPLTEDLFQEVYPWTRWIPNGVINRVSPYVPPVFLGRLRQITSPATDFQAEGILLTLGGTPHGLIGRDQRFIQRRLLQAAHLAERLDARLVGVSAYSAIMGEGAELVSHKTDVAVTSGRNLTMAGALEAALQAFNYLRESDGLPRVMVVNANRPEAAACARYLAPRCEELILVANRPEHLSPLRQEILVKYPQLAVHISNTLGSQMKEIDLVISTLSDLEKPLGPTLDLGRCYPGTVICDLGRPPLLARQAVQQRPDLLVIHGAEFKLPGSPESDIRLGVGANSVPAALAEAALLALEGRFEDFSLDRTPDVERWREIINLAAHHHFELAGPRQFNVLLGLADYRAARQAVGGLATDPAQIRQIMEQPIVVNEPQTGRPANGTLIMAGLGLFAILAGGLGWLWRGSRRRDRRQEGETDDL